MDLDLRDHVCLVTGSTGGIGLATVNLLRAEGATVVSTGRSGGDVRADLTQAAVPGMRARGAGTIVNVSSTAAKRPSASMPDYSVMKAAMLSFSRLVADLYAKDGVRCNAVTPGPTATEAWLGDGGLADQQGDRAEVLARVGASRPLGRFAEPD